MQSKGDRNEETLFDWPGCARGRHPARFPRFCLASFEPGLYQQCGFGWQAILREYPDGRAVEGRRILHGSEDQLRL